MRKKLSEEKIKELISDYQSGNFTRRELAAIYEIAIPTVNNYLKGIHKTFKYDAMDKSISLDWLKDHGIEPTAKNVHIMELVPLHEIEEQWTHNLIKCTTCEKFYTSKKLLTHMIQYHQRHDLEYLLEGE